MLAEKQRGRLSNWYVQAWARYHLRRLGRKDYMSTDEHDPYHLPYGQPRYIMTRTEHNGSNKIVWWVAASLVTLFLVTIIGAQVWMLNMMIGLQAQISDGSAIDAVQNAVIAMMQEALRMLQQGQ